MPRLVKVSSEVKKALLRPAEVRRTGTNSRLLISTTVTVKGSALTAVPPGVTTLIGPLVASGGTMARILVIETTSNSRELTRLNRTSVTPRKWVPVTVTLVPTGPLAGVNPVMFGGSCKVIVVASFENSEAAFALKASTRK